MSRMLKALQTLENRKPSPPSDPTPAAPPPAAEGLTLVDSLMQTVEDELLVEPATPQPKAEEPVEKPQPADVPQQYYELAANMAQDWDMPVTIALVGGTSGRSHEAVGLSLAVALHELLGVEVLLVDGDFREPAFAPDSDQPQPGLTELISGAADCRKLAAATKYSGVYLLAAHWDAETQKLPDFGRLLAACSKSFPLVIVVAPPLDYPEAIPLAAACEGTYLVVRLGYVSDGAARHLTANLRAAGVRMVGAVALLDE
jgi:Mrp family chromosome partitioning ATPase